MSEEPKRIWVIRDKYVVDPDKSCEHTVEYIRADLVDELVAALKYCLEFNGHAFMYDDSKALAAIKKLEES